jgi:flagellar protein FliJ
MTERSLAKRLLPLIDRAAHKEAEAARGLAVERNQLQAQELRMQELKEYLHEYASSGESATLPSLMLNRIAFIDRLDVALRQQQRLVEQGENSCALHRTQYFRASRDTEILERVAARHRADEEQALVRREQRELDDLSARRNVGLPTADL